MPGLRCSVGACTNNAHGLCALNGISVSGGLSKENTSCVSFTNGPSYSNSIGGQVSENAEISCQAKDCVYNQSCSCQASSIEICNCGSSNSCDGTECGSFKCK